MKKLLILLSILSMFFINMTDSHASNKLSLYEDTISSINEKYGTDIHIMSEEEFDSSSLKDEYASHYDNYIQSILNTDLEDIKKECMNMVTIDNEINVSIVSYARSILTKKTINFNNQRNSMTLTYKRNGSKFDTSYKPTAIVKKLNNKNYFVMASYTGVFKNSSKTYTVNAKGKIYTGRLVSTKTFTINFNI